MIASETGETVAGLIRAGGRRLVESGSESSRLDAELLLAHALGIDRTTVLAHPEAPVGPAAASTFHSFIERRERGEPVAYIRGLKEFYGLAFAVDSRALIPRPETERVVELAAARVSDALSGEPRSAGVAPFRIWDVGTGSGAIAVTLAVICRRRRYGDAVEIMATDRSPEALALAVENAVGHGVADRITFGTGDLFAVSGVSSPVDLVIANLPYVPSEAVPQLPVAASFEPTLALDGGPDGLTLVRALLRCLPDALASAGQAIIEIGSQQAVAALTAAEHARPGWRFSIEDDLSGRARVLVVDRS